MERKVVSFGFLIASLFLAEELKEASCSTSTSSKQETRREQIKSIPKAHVVQIKQPEFNIYTK